MDTFQLTFNTASETWGLLLCLSGIICSRMLRTDDERMKSYCLRLFLVSGAALLTDLIGLNCDGRSGSLCHAMVLGGNTLTFMSAFVVVVMVSEYQLEILGREKLLAKIWRVTAVLVGLAAVAALVVNMFQPLFFQVNTDNMYERTENFPILLMIFIVIEAGNFALSMINRKKISRIQKFWFHSYSALPVAAAVVQIRNYGFSWINITLAILVILSFVEMMAQSNQAIYQQRVQMAKQEAELAESRTQIMLSQIQPHFLYNSLNSIYYLCGKDPKKAQTAVGDFADYLRANLDSLKKREMIPFPAELRHIRTYLLLEQLRFDERLNVAYDIQAKDFMLPALTIQPLVENAVKHGICSRPKGGTVTILTRETENEWEVIVRDDGIGFDPSVKPVDGRSHIGLENVSRRLELETAGKLEIHSVVGEGTDAIVKIPRTAMLN